tara:strand:- start:553 stop:756 length:204 start_codon:yes stop_codon:yes gene_type:complete
MSTEITLHLINDNSEGRTIKWTLEELHVFKQQFRSGYYNKDFSYFTIENGSFFATGTRFTIREWEQY